MLTFADRIISFNRQLNFSAELPTGVAVMNPFQENPLAVKASEAFYRKFYDDHCPRHLLIGINPGRFGAGQTGVPFTDPIRLREACGIDYAGGNSREASSVFIYEMIEAFGGVEKFYSKFLISALSPLGFTQITSKGTQVNHNYYDSKALLQASYPFILDCLRKQCELGIERETVICLGTGKNYQIFRKINQEHGFFKHILPLEHPRFILQYKSKEKAAYLQKYLDALLQVTT